MCQITERVYEAMKHDLNRHHPSYRPDGFVRVSPLTAGTVHQHELAAERPVAVISAIGACAPIHAQQQLTRRPNQVQIEKTPTSAVELRAPRGEAQGQSQA